MIESFGQTVPPLVDYLKNLLDIYPAGPQIIRELLQNADDAGASEFCFAYDSRQHTLEGLIPNLGSMEIYQGPAFVAYNNAMFTEKDFDSLRSIGRSAKKQDALKTGQYGLGFCSVYHVTDFPCLVSANNVIFFDPLQKAIGEMKECGIKLDISAISKFPGQCDPFHGLFGCDIKNGSTFNGTMFRFPLRTQKESPISSELFPVEKREHYLNSFSKEASDTVIFLKNIKTLKVYHIDESEAKEILNIQIQFQNEQEKNRSKIIEFLENPLLNLRFLKGPEIYHYEMRIFIDREKVHETQDWIVSCCIGVGTARNMAIESLSRQGKRIPFGSVATMIKNNKIALKNGNVYCCLPLPVATNLPVHFNSHFEISQNRRGIIDLKIDLEGKAKERALFNDSLKKHVLCPAYLHLLDLLKTRLKIEEYYSLIPDLQKHKQGKWNLLVREMYLQMNDWNILPIESDDNQEFAFVNQLHFLSSADKSFTAIMKAISHDPEIRVAKKNIPDHIVITLDKLKYVKYMKPKMIRKCMKNSSIKFSTQENVQLLEYCMKDNEYKDLIGCKLIPLLNGESECIGSKNRILLVSPGDLDILGKTQYTDRISSVKEGDIGYDIMLKLAREFPSSNLKKADINDIVLLLIENNDPSLISSYFQKPTVNSISLSDSTLKILKKTKFILTKAGEYRYPEDVCKDNSEISVFLNDDRIAKSECFSPYFLNSLGVTEKLDPNFITPMCEKIIREGITVATKFVLTISFKKDIKKEKKKWKKSFEQIKSLPWFPSMKYSTDQDSHQEMLCSPVNVVLPMKENLKYMYTIPLSQIDKDLAEIIGIKQISVEHLIGEIEKLSKRKYKSHKKLFLLMHDTYDILENYCNKDKKESKKIFSSLKKFKSILVSDTSTFVFPSQLCQGLSESINGFYYNSSPILNFKKLCNGMKIHNGSVVDLLLQLLEKDIPSSQKSYDEKVKDALIALRMISENHLQDIGKKKIFSPTAEIDKFRPIHQLFFGHYEFGNLDFVHPTIPISISMSLGAQSVVNYFESKNSVPIFDGEDFEQQETLHTRIKNILSEYLEENGRTVFIEFLQNAEDAGANSFEIVLDKRKHGTEKLTSSSLGEFQGESLLIINDSTFREEDFTSLKNLGGKNKLERGVKIGRYGIGLNSCFHYTDVLSILTDRYMVILDPQKKFLNGKVAGKKYDLFSDSFYLKIEDHMKSFDYEKSEPCNSTIFRIPLRKNSNSELSNYCPSLVDMETKLNDFASYVEEAIIFLSNIREVSLKIIEIDGSVKQLKKILKKHEDMNMESAHAAVRRFADSLSKGGATKHISQPLTFQSRLKTISITESSSSEEQWAIFSVLSPNFCTKYSKADSSRMIPFGSVAIKMDTSGYFTEVCGRIYCSLPLQANTGLPYHINGYFEPEVSRRDIIIINSHDIGGKWNGFIMENCIAQAVVNSIKELLQKNIQSDSNWKLIEKKHAKLLELLCVEPENHFANKCIREKIVGIIPSESLYYSPASSDTLHAINDLYIANISSNDVGFEEFLIKDGFKFSRIPDKLFLSIKKMKKLKIVSPATISEFYSKKFSEKIPTNIETSADGLLSLWKYCNNKNFPIVTRNNLINSRNDIFSAENSIVDNLLEILPEAGRYFAHVDIAKYVKSQKFDLYHLSKILDSQNISCESQLEKLWETVITKLEDKFVIHPLSEHKLIPTCGHGIFRVSDREKVIYIAKDDKTIIASTFKKLELPITHIQHTGAKPLSCCSDLSKIIKRKLEGNGSKLIEKLNSVEMDSIINFFSKDLENIKNLPLFETADEKRIPLGNDEFTYICFDQITVGHKIVCPPNTYVMRRKYGNLGIHIFQSHLAYYKSDIFKKYFKALEVEEKKNFLSHADSSLLETLKDFDFIFGKKPSGYYDPTVPMFRDLLPSYLLLPAEYHSKKMIEILKKLGLRTNVETNSVILEMGKKLEGKLAAQQNLDNQRELMDAFFSLCRKIPVNGLEKLKLFPIDDKYNETKKLTSLSKAALLVDADICYSTRNIIHKDFETHAIVISSDLKCKLKPGYDDILEHLKTMRDKCDHTSKSTFLKLYTALLDNESSRINDVQFSELSIIFVNGIFVKPSQVFWEFAENQHYPPYFFGAQNYMRDDKLREMFLRWGVHEHPSSEMCEKILRQFVKATSLEDDVVEKMTPNQTNVAIKCIQILYSSDYVPKNKYLVTSDEKLVPQRLVYLDDCKAISSCIKRGSIHYLHPDLYPFADKLILKRVSSIIEKVTVQDELPEQEITKKLQERLHHEEFRKGIQRIAEHQCNSIGMDKGKMKSISIDISEKLASLSKMKVRLCKTFKTELKDSKGIDITDSNSKQSDNALCVIDNISKCIFLHEDWILLGRDMSFVAESIHTYLGGVLHEHGGKIVTLLQVEDPLQISKLLDRMRISNAAISSSTWNQRMLGKSVSKEDMDVVSSKSAGNKNAKSLPSPGELLVYVNKNTCTNVYAMVQKIDDKGIHIDIGQGISHKIVKDEELVRFSHKVAEIDGTSSLEDTLTCCITQEIFEDPVIMSDGHTYEKSAIEKYLETATRPVSPLTREELFGTPIKNHLIRKIIQMVDSGKI